MEIVYESPDSVSNWRISTTSGAETKHRFWSQPSHGGKADHGATAESSQGNYNVAHWQAGIDIASHGTITYETTSDGTPHALLIIGHARGHGFQSACEAATACL